MPVEIVIESPAMRRAVDFAGRSAAAPMTTTLLVTGETGTGKDLIARFVHEQSGATGPLVTIDCASLPETLLESELFGHERGAYTGAAEARAGRLEAARGGTLVLDEIAALAPSAQAKLLRLLDERRFTRLGSNRALELDARVIALTNVDLALATESGAFRSDLYFRLNVVAIELPPLRDQPEAIAPLAELFARRFAHAARAGTTIVQSDAVRALVRYAFPGNVRELRSAIEQAVVRGSGKRIRAHDLPERIRDVVSVASVGRSTLAEVEAAYVRSVLEDVGGNKSLAARMLGISRKNLYERLRRDEPADGGER
jgi:DNA-binding NtrC family response regulator